MTKVLTHIERVRRQSYYLKMEVQNLLGWDDLQYGSFQEQMGYEYLKAEFPEGTVLVAELPYHKEFWTWWKMQWMERDELFLSQAYSMDRAMLQEYYRQFHSPMDESFKPHRIVLENAYSGMIDRLIKEALQCSKEK